MGCKHWKEGKHARSDEPCPWCEAVALRTALTELVELKALKDKIDNHVMLEFHEARRIPEMEEDYARRKPLAWQAARALVPNG